VVTGTRNPTRGPDSSPHGFSPALWPLLALGTVRSNTELQPDESRPLCAHILPGADGGASALAVCSCCSARAATSSSYEQYSKGPHSALGMPFGVVGGPEAESSATHEGERTGETRSEGLLPARPAPPPSSL